MQDQSSKIGSSSSPLVNSVIQNTKGETNQNNTTAQAALSQKHTDHPFKTGK